LLLVIGIGVVSRSEQSQRRFNQLVTGDKIDDDRFRYWDSAIQLWKEEPWLGAGPGHYDYRFRQYRSEAVQDRPQYAHNDYLNTLADWGIIGLGLIAIFLVLFYVGVFKAWRFVQRNPDDLTSKRSNRAAYVLGGSFGVLAIVFHSVLDFNMQIPANVITLLTIAALVTAHLRYASETYWNTIGTVGKTCFTLISLVGIVYLGQQAVRQTREEICLRATMKEREYTDRKIELLKNVVAAEPGNFEVAYTLGEIYRGRSWAGGPKYESLAQEAMQWYQRSLDLNPFNPYAQLRYGMCLDWIGKTNEAGAHFERAHELDPNGYYTAAHQGWHQLQLGNYAEAKKYFELSQRLRANNIAESYLEIIEQKLVEPDEP
jgi:tetratricopeptide (TPR) repeat protein